MEENNYYPFGLKHSAYNNTNLANANYKYKYQGQERQDELGLNWDSFKWRNYDPAIGRFFNVDPLSEKYAYQSHYNFSENKVTSHRELEGLEAVFWQFVFDSKGNRTNVEEIKRFGPSLIGDDGGGYYIKGSDDSWHAVPSNYNKSLINTSFETINGWPNADLSYNTAEGLEGGEVLGQYVAPILVGVAARFSRSSPTRPSWRQSEDDVLSSGNYRKQISFKDGQEVKYGTKGSVRPEGYKIGSSIEVKNYNITTRSGQNSLINNVSGQINKRLENLPKGTAQTVVIDVRGQKFNSDIMKYINEQIGSKVNTENYQIMFKFK
ncbi:RHS repeat-associated core domain-containing protein [Empedobacter tilapiae]